MESSGIPWERAISRFLRKSRANPPREPTGCHEMSLNSRECPSQAPDLSDLESCQAQRPGVFPSHTTQAGLWLSNTLLELGLKAVRAVAAVSRQPSNMFTIFGVKSRGSSRHVMGCRGMSWDVEGSHRYSSGNYRRDALSSEIPWWDISRESHPTVGVPRIFLSS